MMTVDEIKDRCNDSLAGTPAVKAMLFGSYARGAQSRRSDIDLMLIEKTDKPFFRRFEDFPALYNVFKGEEIDILFYTPDEVARMSHRRFIRSILSEGVVVYER